MILSCSLYSARQQKTKKDKHLDMEHVEAKLEKMRLERDKALSELHNMKKVTSKTLNVRSKSLPDVTIDISNLKAPLEEAMKSNAEKAKQMETKLAEKEALIDAMKEELNSLKSSMVLADGVLSERSKMVEELKAEVERRKDSEKKLSDSNDIQTGQLERANSMIENLRIRFLSLKDKMQGGVFDENRRLKSEVDRLDYELRLQRERTATDEVIMLRNELRRAMEAEENNKRAMDELALVISEVAMEANQAKEKLASAEEKIRVHNVALSEAKACKTALDEARKENIVMRETIDQLRIEAEKEEDEKTGLQEENYMLVELLTELEETSNKLREDTEKLKYILKESFDETEMAKAESFELMDSLVENERRQAIFTQENKRLREYEAAGNDNIKEKKKLITSSPEVESKSSGGEEKEQKKLTPSSSKEELKSHGGEEKEPKKLVPSSSKKEHKSHGGEEKEHKWLLPSFSKKEKSSSIVEEKDQKKASTPSSSKKEHKSSSSSHWAEEKEYKKIRKDSLDKDSKPGNAHSKLMCFDPVAMLPIPGMSSKHKEAGNPKERDDDLTDSIFDLVESSNPRRNRKHRRTTSALEDEKSIKLDEFDHKERPHLDDIVVERAGTHSTKKIVLLKRLGDLWKRKNQSHSHSHSHSHNNSYSHSPNHNNNQDQNIHEREVTS